jgi:hypothetical protein
LIECGETRRRTGLPNLPREPDSYPALLDLAREISGRIVPKLDQYAAHERNRRGEPICERMGAAADFIVDDEDLLEVPRWVAAHTPFDRLYISGGTHG